MESVFWILAREGAKSLKKLVLVARRGAMHLQAGQTNAVLRLFA